MDRVPRNRGKLALYSIWAYECPLPNTSWTIQGHSRGSERTSFYIRELKLFIDAGIQSTFLPDRIFITHCHADHSNALPALLTGVSGRMIDIYVPQEHVNLFSKYVESSYRLSQGLESLVSRFPINGVSPGQEVPLTRGKAAGGSFVVRVYDMCHSVPTRGYGILVKGRRLRTPYRQLSGAEIVVLKKQLTHDELFEDALKPLVLFAFDTTVKVFQDTPELLTYKTIITECTFLFPEHRELAVSSMHVHWEDIRPIIESHPNVTFILTHFSARYTDSDIETFFAGSTGNLRNIMPWMN